MNEARTSSRNLIRSIDDFLTIFLLWNIKFVPSPFRKISLDRPVIFTQTPSQTFCLASPDPWSSSRMIFEKLSERRRRRRRRMKRFATRGMKYQGTRKPHIPDRISDRPRFADESMLILSFEVAYIGARIWWNIVLTLQSAKKTKTNSAREKKKDKKNAFECTQNASVTVISGSEWCQVGVMTDNHSWKRNQNLWCRQKRFCCGMKRCLLYSGVIPFSLPSVWSFWGSESAGAKKIGGRHQQFGMEIEMPLDRNWKS